MKNVSNLNLNILVEKLYVESAVNRIFEGISDFDWIGQIEPTLKDPNFTFDSDYEYWVDLERLKPEEKKVVFDYIKKVIGLAKIETKFNNLSWYGVVIHCGSEEHDYEPEEGAFCFMDIPFDQDENNQNSVYIDGREVYDFAMYGKSKNINESVNLLKETEDKSIIKQVIDDLGLTRRLLFTFSTGMAAFIEPVTNLLNGSGVHLNRTQVIMLLITSVAILLQNVSTDKAIEKLKEEGIFGYLDNVIDVVTDIKELLNSILKKVTNVTYGLTDVLGFAFIMVPFMKVLNELIIDNGINMSSIKQLSMGLMGGILSYTVKNVVNKIKKRLN